MTRASSITRKASRTWTTDESRKSPGRRPEAMRRFILPLIGILAAAWAAYAIVHTTTHRESTIPPSPPPVSDFRDTVAALGLVETSTENIAIVTPLSGIVPKVFVGAGDAVRAGDPLFELDTRQLRAELDVRRQTLAFSLFFFKVAAPPHIYPLPHPASLQN